LIQIKKFNQPSGSSRSDAVSDLRNLRVRPAMIAGPDLLWASHGQPCQETFGGLLDSFSRHLGHDQYAFRASPTVSTSVPLTGQTFDLSQALTEER
jgi:hypothetical protein